MVFACRLCADICEACANECAKHDTDHCRECATVCLSCAKMCRQM
ncbi:MAG TPA: four-helix bundle copper-binding protein [Panacibacter sp.]|nr:four-helix bundle copper-binding protein [Panacibacter sp.]HNP46480.1 four-helix bundle copper-binding protein [Panacibacter sp.]